VLEIVRYAKSEPITNRLTNRSPISNASSDPDAWIGDDDTGCRGRWTLTPMTGEVVLGAQAQTIWLSAERRPSLEKLLDRVQARERGMVASALRDTHRLCGLDLRFCVMSREGSRHIWVYFSKMPPVQRSFRAWCVDLMPLK